MKKLKISMKEIRLCVISLSLILFIVTYFVLYDGLVEKTNILKKDKAVVDQQIEERISHLQEAEEMKDKIKIMQQQMRDLLEQYPSQMTLPDILLLFSEFEKNNELTFSSLSYGENIPFYDTTIPQVDGEAGAFMSGVQNTVSVTYQGTYEQVKDWMKYVEEYPMRLSLDQISMSYDDTTGLVNGSMSISIYAIKGNGVPYIPPMLDSIPIGKENIFLMKPQH